jgi:hypothetical protein
LNSADTSAGQQLLETYQEWRRLADAEGEAIRTRNWLLAGDCQDALQRLQPLILQYTQQAKKEWKRLGQDSTEKENSFRELITQLIQIESQNSALLGAMRSSTQAHLGQLEQASRTLRKVQRFYAPRPPAAWSSFS